MSEQALSSQTYWREVDVACRLAQEAGKLILEYYDRTTRVSYKAGDEPVTEADQAASDHILAGLHEAFPDDVLVSEEEPDNPLRREDARLWVIDPLDGTKEFIARNGEFSVMIGFVVGERPVVGVVYQPTRDRLWWAAHDQAFLRIGGEQKSMKVSSTTDYAAMRMVVSRSHRNALVDQMATRLGMTQEIVSGSGGIKVGLIADGDAEIMFSPNPYTKIWDMCACDVILHAAGGKVTDLQGNLLAYRGEELFNLKGVLATNGTRHDDIIQAVAGIYVPPV
ncbi:MAG: 3'(2'),5'-bisphosphate nucleotidase CysQ [Acidobacteria bacterium]|nr:3'(2'),5'-bisphosphate nucleotidase CysQ [Acidobacteriota bacterium]